jgi:hypothetical protein
MSISRSMAMVHGPWYLSFSSAAPARHPRGATKNLSISSAADGQITTSC